VISGILNRT